MSTNYVSGVNNGSNGSFLSSEKEQKIRERIKERNQQREDRQVKLFSEREQLSSELRLLENRMVDVFGVVSDILSNELFEEIPFDTKMKGLMLQYEQRLFKIKVLTDEIETGITKEYKREGMINLPKLDLSLNVKGVQSVEDFLKRQE